MVKISVIIPTYNIENHIQKCLDSVINQSFKDMEIICIDDKSTDNTLNILNEYASKDPRIKVYQKEENKGIGDSRNLSLTLAKGKYIFFLDSDDYIVLDALEKAYNTAEEKSLDILMFKMIHFYEDTEDYFKIGYTEMRYLKRIVPDKVFTYKDVVEYFFYICVNLQCKLFRRDLICDMRFPTERIFEDAPFFIEAMIKAKRMYFLEEYLTYKCERKSSLTNSHNERDADIINMMDHNGDLIKRYGIYDELKTAYLQYRIKFIALYYWRIKFKYKPEFYVEMRNDFIGNKQTYDEVYEDLYKIYQIVYDSCTTSENDKIFMLKTSSRFLMHFPRFIIEIIKEYSIWR